MCCPRSSFCQRIRRPFGQPFFWRSAGLTNFLCTRTNWATAVIRCILCVKQTNSQRKSGNVQSPRNVRLSENRSEEHTSELQSRFDLVCRLLLEKKKTTKTLDHRAQNI